MVEKAGDLIEDSASGRRRTAEIHTREPRTHGLTLPDLTITMDCHGDERDGIYRRKTVTIR